MLQAKTERQKHLPTRMKVAKSLFKHSINLFHEINIVSTLWNEESTIKTAVYFCNKPLCGNALLHCQQTFWIQSLLEFITYIPLCNIWANHSEAIDFPRIHMQKSAMHHYTLENISLLDQNIQFCFQTIDYFCVLCMKIWICLDSCMQWLREHFRPVLQERNAERSQERYRDICFHRQAKNNYLQQHVIFKDP